MNVIPANPYSNPVRVANNTSPALPTAAEKNRGGSDTTHISAAGRAKAAAPDSAYSAASKTAEAVLSTSKGQQTINIDDYFSGQLSGVISLQDLPPLLLPSQQNVDALNAHISASMPGFLKQNNIPHAPESIRYDNAGQMHLPEDYPYADEFKQALADNPAMERQLRTVNALASHVNELNKLAPFQQEYGQASNQAEADAVIDKYSHLFFGNRENDQIQLNFSADGRLSISANGDKLS